MQDKHLFKCSKFVF